MSCPLAARSAFALAVSMAGFVLSGCAPSHVTFHEAVDPQAGPVQAEKPAFYMRPSVLEKTTIFMKRSADKYGPAGGIGRAGSAVHTNSTEWIPLSDYRVVVHVENIPFEKILQDVLTEAAPYVGPWQLKWSLPKEQEDILLERFSLDAETTFDQFIAYLRDYVMNYRGIGITFEMYEADRIIVVKG
ncbi:MAG: hypothetical protein GC134_10010 [Proteobacteria bacterium]|nr:hypothetical protein [Pseudomonadota bacterium]